MITINQILSLFKRSGRLEAAARKFDKIAEREAAKADTYSPLIAAAVLTGNLQVRQSFADLRKKHKEAERVARAKAAELRGRL